MDLQLCHKAGDKRGHWEAFKCPLCGSTHYVEVRVQKPSGQWYVTESYKCSGCSVMFKDPVLFTPCKVDMRNAERTPGAAHTLWLPPKK